MADASASAGKTAPPARPPRPSFPAVGHYSKEPRLAGKVCVISGASRGFGQAIAVRFIEEGAKVVLLSRSSCADTFALIEKIEGLPAKPEDVALWVSADISNEEGIAKAMTAASEKFGPHMHVLVNNAAAFIFHSVEDATAEDWGAYRQTDKQTDAQVAAPHGASHP